MEQEGIYRGKSRTLFKGIHVGPTYTIGKALGTFWKVCTLDSSGTCSGSLSIVVKIWKNWCERTEVRLSVIGWKARSKTRYGVANLAQDAQAGCSGCSGSSGESTEPTVSRRWLAPEQEQQELSVGYHMLARFTGSFSGFMLPYIYTLTVSTILSNLISLKAFDSYRPAFSTKSLIDFFIFTIL